MITTESNNFVTEESLWKKSISVIKKSGMKVFLTKGGKFILRKFEWMRIFFYPYANLSVSSAVEHDYTAKEAIDFAMRKYGGFIRPSQVRSEIDGLAKIVEELHPQNILEIGTSRGGTLFVFSRLATKDACIVSLDLPGGESGGAYPRWKEPFYKKFASKNQHITLLRGDSHSPEALKKVTDVFVDRKIDFLFIDGDHSYEGVKKDFEMYSLLVRKGGVIAFHDIALHPASTGCHVDRLWNEAKQGKKYKELIENRDQKWAGIGVIFV
jgi:predicted O-methyltransferase YrrM